MGFIIAEATNNKLLKELNSRQMFEVASLRQMLTSLYSKFESLQAYLGYKVTEQQDEYWLSFNPSPRQVNENDDQILELLNFLKPSRVFYTKELFGGKRNEALDAKINECLTASAIIKARYSESFSVFSQFVDFEGQLKEKFANSKDLISKIINKDGLTNDDPDRPDKTEFDDFIEEVEKGFSQQIGDIDQDGNPREPYGRGYGERPRIQRFKGSP